MSNPVVQRGLEATNIRYRMLELAAGMGDVISLGRGDPDMDTPRVILERTLDRARHPVRTNPIRGLGELRRAITHRYAEDRLLDLDPERCILVTNGAQEALFLSMMTLVNPGDVVAMPDPRYSSYDQAVGAAGGRLVTIPTGEGRNFELSAEAVREHAADAKVLVFVNPNNPTSACVDQDGVRAIAQAARDMGLIVVYDEIYGDLVYDGRTFQSMAACRGMQDATVTIGGFSKTYAMTGFRVGYLIAEPEFIEAAAALKSAVSGPCPLFSQHAALAAMDSDLEVRPAMLETYAGRRRTMMDGLDAMGIPYGHPGGGLFVWADLSVLGMETEAFCYRLLEDTGVLIFPGRSFGERWRSWVRISLLAPDDRIKEALDRMAAFVMTVRGGSR
jgi:aminotransferase